MTRLSAFQERIRDRLAQEWLTPSQRTVWEGVHRFDGPPHRIINIYGPRGSGKSFLGWLMQRERYATYGSWIERPDPIHPRLVLDNAHTDRASTRNLRPLVDELGILQIILLSRQRVDERAMPAFELQVTSDDLEQFRATLFRQLGIILPEDGEYHNYREAIEGYLARG
jgi:hypothetical protein